MELEKVSADVTETLQRAVENLVEIKRSLNDGDPKPAGFREWANSLSAEHFRDDAFPGWACWPAMTLAAVLPFFDFESRSDSAVRRGLVPVKRLMGSSWRWHEGSLPHGVHTIQEGIAIFTAPNCAEPGLQVAEVTLIRPLGLFYVSGEGKNRVAFLARNNIEWMPCRLAERTYPAAERLQTFEVVEGSIRTWMCVLDSKFAVTLPYPEITIPLLEAYGVRQTAEWPRGWPMCATAITAVRLQPTRDGFSLRSRVSDIVDLEKLLQGERTVRQPRPEHWTLLLAHPAVVINRRVFAWTAATALGLLSIVLLTRLPEPISA